MALFSSIASAFTGRHAHPGIRPARPATADVVEGGCFAALSVAIAHAVASGAYTSLATPRSKPYLIATAILLGLMAIATWLGVFHTDATDAGKSPRWLVALIIPSLLVSVPFHQSSTSAGFDAYASGRAIPIARNVYSPNGVRHLHGLDAKHRTITIANDEFGAWFEQIDHNPQRYVGYRVRVTGFVSRSRTYGRHEFQVARQFMSCCILDMTPFGFMASSDGKTPAEHQWVTVEARLENGTYVMSGYERQGLMLRVVSLHQTKNTPTGYFYWQ